MEVVDGAIQIAPEDLDEVVEKGQEQATREKLVAQEK